MLGLPLGRTLAKLRGRQVEWEHRPQSRSRSRLGRRHLKEQPLEEEVDMGLVRHLEEQPLEEEVDMGLVGGPCAWQASSGLNPKASGVSTAGYSKADAEKEDLKGAQEEEVEVRRMKRVKLQLQEMIRAKPNRAASWPKASGAGRDGRRRRRRREVRRMKEDWKGAGEEEEEEEVRRMKRAKLQLQEMISTAKSNRAASWLRELAKLRRKMAYEERKGHRSYGCEK